jgi:hypothetical protein
MKATGNIRKLAKVETWFSALLVTLCIISGSTVFAQTTVPEKVDVNINTDGAGTSSGWYAQPWVWVVGVAVFIIVIIAITRSGSTRRDV